ncbi:glutamate racemase, partial [Gardnerella sp. KA00735]
LRERKFADLLNRFACEHTIFSQPCPDLVRIVEDGKLNDRDFVNCALHKYFA